MSIETCSITLSNQTLRIPEIERLDSAHLSQAEQHALSFCRAWLGGQAQFEVHTSGSTGQPKSIRISRDQMIASARLTQNALGLTAGMTSLVCLDTRYIAGQMMIVRCLVIGMNMIIVDPVANPVEELDEKCRVDFTAMVPYQVKSILSSPHPRRLNLLKTVLIGGGEVDDALEKKLREFTPTFYATYGMTETITHIALKRLNGSEDAFSALEGVHLTLDHRGCLSVQADYLGAEPILTNDLIKLVGPTKFRWLGRVDFVINTGGVKVVPEKIEKAISGIAAMLNENRRYFVHGFPHETLGHQVTLVMEGEPLDSRNEILLLEQVRGVVNRFEVPRQIIYVDRFAATATGKINRNLTAALASPPPLSE